jgi:hypothetical protein
MPPGTYTITYLPFLMPAVVLLIEMFWRPDWLQLTEAGSGSEPVTRDPRSKLVIRPLVPAPIPAIWLKSSFTRRQGWSYRFIS